MFGINVIMAATTLAFMLRQAFRVVAMRRQQMRDAITGLSRFKYSLNLVPLARFEAAGKLTTHEEMRDSGELKVFDLWEDALLFAQNKTIVFFSHRMPQRGSSPRHRQAHRGVAPTSPSLPPVHT